MKISRCLDLNPVKRVIAGLELLFIFPALLFMAALFARDVQPIQYEPAHTAQRIVDWYAARPRLGLWILLIGLPCAVLLTGSVTLWRAWTQDGDLRLFVRQTVTAIRAHLAPVLVAAATLAAGAVLAIVALHIITD